MKIIGILFFMCVLFPHYHYAQRIQNIEASTEGDKVYIRYDLVAAPYLGCTVEQMTEKDLVNLDLKEIGGIKVTDVNDPSPAERMDLQPGDIITRAGSLNIESVAQFRNFIKNHSPGERIVLQVLRKMQYLEIAIKLSDNRNPCSIEVYSSHDNFKRPLQYVQGDAGNLVFPGGNKTITWLGEKEIGDYEGPLRFELRGRIVRSVNNVPPLKTSFPDKTRIKRGKKYTIRWSGGLPESSINIDLYQGKTHIEPVARDILNAREYEWVIPRSKKNGNNFHLLITDQKYKGNRVESGKFKVVTPLNPMIQASIAVAAILGIYAVIQTQ